MRREAERIYSGDESDCPNRDRGIPRAEPLTRLSVLQGYAIVHACKWKCHAAKCGPKLPKDDPNYLSYAEPARNPRRPGALYLNMIDPEEPLFSVELFRRFLDWTVPQWTGGESVLIHCNQGESRSRSLALLLMVKVEIIPAGLGATYDRARESFDMLTKKPLQAGKGITTFLREHWNEVLTAGQR